MAKPESQRPSLDGLEEMLSSRRQTFTLFTLSKKSPRIAELLAGLPSGGRDPHYLGFFACFNTQLFFEAHDVLEQLWLANGKDSPDYRFYKGLIQLAGAFVHLQKGRLRPAVALFRLSESNISAYAPLHHGLDIEQTMRLIRHYQGSIEVSEFTQNPLETQPPPSLNVSDVVL